METTDIGTNGLNSYTGALFENLIDGSSADNPANGILNNGDGNIYVTMIIYLLVIGLVIAVLLFVRKYLLNRLGAIKNGSYMRIIDRIAVSNDKHIVLIELSNKILVIGITQQRIETLSEFSKDGFDVIAQMNGGGDKNTGFMSMLTEKLANTDTAKKHNDFNKPNNSNENSKNE